jgi:DNA-binding transcriptional ArsR family regulator
MRRDVFQAIADPNRRAILGLLASKKLTLNGVAKKFRITRPAVSRHMKILAECGLVDIRQQGRERYCEARLDRLNEVTDWVKRHKELWEVRLDALNKYLAQLHAKEKRSSRKK